MPKLPRSYGCMHRRSIIVFRRCAKVANGVDLPFAPKQNVKDDNGATLFSMTERRYFEKMFCYLRGWTWMFSNEWKAN